jgi:hypothetical protein
MAGWLRAAPVLKIGQPTGTRAGAPSALSLEIPPRAVVAEAEPQTTMHHENPT